MQLTLNTYPLKGKRQKYIKQTFITCIWNVKRKPAQKGLFNFQYTFSPTENGWLAIPHPSDIPLLHCTPSPPCPRAVSPAVCPWHRWWAQWTQSCSTRRRWVWPGWGTAPSGCSCPPPTGQAPPWWWSPRPLPGNQHNGTGKSCKTTQEISTVAQVSPVKQPRKSAQWHRLVL